MFGSATHILDTLTDNTIHDLMAVVLASTAVLNPDIEIAFFVISGLMLGFKIFKIVRRSYLRFRAPVMRELDDINEAYKRFEKSEAAQAKAEGTPTAC